MTEEKEKLQMFHFTDDQFAKINEMTGSKIKNPVLVDCNILHEKLKTIEEQKKDYKWEIDNLEEHRDRLKNEIRILGEKHALAPKLIEYLSLKDELRL